MITSIEDHFLLKFLFACPPLLLSYKFPANSISASAGTRRKKGRETMRPASAMQSSSVPNMWHTPVPYLFGGFGAVMILIAAALVVLACSHWRSTRARSSDMSSLSERPVIVQLAVEPGMVVIMAGDSKPSFIAKPFSLAEDEPSAV